MTIPPPLRKHGGDGILRRCAKKMIFFAQSGNGYAPVITPPPGDFSHFRKKNSYFFCDIGLRFMTIVTGYVIDIKER